MREFKVSLDVCKDCLSTAPTLGIRSSVKCLLTGDYLTGFLDVPTDCPYRFEHAIVHGVRAYDDSVE